MTNHIYRMTEIVGTSPESIDTALRNGIRRASQTLRNLDWFEVTQIRGALDENGVEHYQVGLKIGFRVEDVG
jgi:flavin-binding protein dodecin